LCLGAKQSAGGGVRNQVAYWKLRAKDTRMVAESMHDGTAREALLQIADDWEKMAKDSEEKIVGESGVTLVPASSVDDGAANPQV
jgi:hypothetical protein